ncbi:glutamyl-tRNA(Gln) amidotransferase subunit C, mitochondrial [Musca domestica]|uniref:Glutamyl-tRNA(Gln) amidotransferase subunit C, mitochondrial n=1 Tax=Musca domestica TaxID=7370 RepID=A0A1I8M1V4_MUSDO|nr:glutamyl-tRNA(Gln) amidotransferase subunit C, mitochondrial [Musca domestica]
MNLFTRSMNFSIRLFRNYCTWRQLNFNRLKHPTKIPQCYETNITKSNNIRIDSKTLQLLERLSLVNLDGREAFEVLQKSICFAESIANTDTDNIKPVYRILFEEPLYLRLDVVTEGNCRDDILQNAQVTDEDYFIAPPGNVPLHQGNVSL